MKKITLTTLSVVALCFASCTTDNLPTESNGSANKINNQIAKESNPIANEINQIQQDTTKTNNVILNSASRTLENGDLANIKDKRK